MVKLAPIAVYYAPSPALCLSVRDGLQRRVLYSQQITLCLKNRRGKLFSIYLSSFSHLIHHVAALNFYLYFFLTWSFIEQPHAAFILLFIMARNYTPPHINKPCCLGGELFPWGFATGRFSCCLTIFLYIHTVPHAGSSHADAALKSCWPKMIGNSNLHACTCLCS
jgi:hypothetical protein